MSETNINESGDESAMHYRPERRRRPSRSSRSGRHTRRGTSRQHETIGERVNRQFVLAGAICIAMILIVAAYMLGRQQALSKAAALSKPSKSPVSATLPSALPDSAPVLDKQGQDALIQAIKAREEGNFANFLEMMDALFQEGQTPAWHDLLMAKARLAEADASTAADLISKMLSKPLPPDPAFAEFSSSMSLTYGDAPRALFELEESLAVNPSSWSLRLAKAESLRKSGKPAEGLNAMLEAELFADSPWAISILRLKSLLAGVEAGHPASLERIKQGLAQQPDAAHWQIAGAAAALAENDKSTASALLQSARRSMDAQLYGYFLSDTVFDFHRMDSDLAPLLQAAP